MNEIIQSDPSFYAVIPAYVRYNKNLTANAKLLYGEITALCNKEGFCWANNKYFAELYKVSERSIQAWLKQLENEGYIKIEIEQNFKRKIFIVQEVCKNLHRGMKKSSEGYEENFTKNITMNNTINNNYSSSKNNEVPSEKEKIVKEEKISSLNSYRPPGWERCQYFRSLKNNTIMKFWCDKMIEHGYCPRNFQVCMSWFNPIKKACEPFKKDLKYFAIMKNKIIDELEKVNGGIYQKAKDYQKKQDFNFINLLKQIAGGKNINILKRM